MGIYCFKRKNSIKNPFCLKTKRIFGILKVWKL